MSLHQHDLEDKRKKKLAEVNSLNMLSAKIIKATEYQCIKYDIRWNTKGNHCTTYARKTKPVNV